VALAAWTGERIATGQQSAGSKQAATAGGSGDWEQLTCDK